MVGGGDLLVVGGGELVVVGGGELLVVGGGEELVVGGGEVLVGAGEVLVGGGGLVVGGAGVVVGVGVWTHIVTSAARAFVQALGLMRHQPKMASAYTAARAGDKHLKLLRCMGQENGR